MGQAALEPPIEPQKNIAKSLLAKPTNNQDMNSSKQQSLVDVLNNLKNRSVCIIEADMVYSICCRALLREEGIAQNFVTFEEGNQALEWLLGQDEATENTPDILFLNTNLPDMDGWELLESLEQFKPALMAKMDCYIVNHSISKKDQQNAERHTVVKNFFPKPLQDEHIKKIKEKDLEGLIFKLYQPINSELSA